MALIDLNNIERLLRSFYNKIDNKYATKSAMSTALSNKADKSHGTHLTLGTTSSNAYRGDYGNTAYVHSQITHAPSNAQKNSDITKAEIEAKLIGTVTSHTHTYAGSSSVGGAATSANKVNTNLVVKLNSGSTEGTNLFTFNGSSAKTINITPSSIGAATSSHGTHVTYSTTAPKVAGTAAVGSESSVARGDHVHTAQTSVSGNAGTATKLQTARNIQIGNKTISFDGSANIAYTLSDIGAAASSHGTHVSYGGNGSASTVSRSDHTHSYLPLSGGKMTGDINIANSKAIKLALAAAATKTDDTTIAAGTYVDALKMSTGDNIHLGAGIFDNNIKTGATYVTGGGNLVLRTVAGNVDIKPANTSVISVSSGAIDAAKNIYAKAGIKSGGNIYSDTAVTDNLGTSALPWNAVYSKQFNIGGEASKSYGYINAYTIGTTSATGDSRLVLGNNTASGTAGNASGSIFLYGTNTGYTRIVPLNNTTSNITINLPSGNGNIPLMNKGDTSYWGMVTPDGGGSWVRTTASGLIPSDQNKASSIGTSSWQFKAMYAETFYGALSGNASSATKLATARALKIGKTSKNFNGTGDLSWSLEEIMSGQGLPSTAPCSTLYFNNSGTSHQGRISCYANSEKTADYVNLGIMATDSTSVINYLNIYDTYMTTPNEFRCGSNIRVNGKRLSITTSAPSSPATGDIWIDI